MSLEIKSYHTADIENIKEWQPAELSDVYFTLEMNIGDVGCEKSFLYSISIATEEGLRKYRDTFNVSATQLKNEKRLMVKSYNWQSIFKQLNDIVSSGSYSSLNKILDSEVVCTKAT